MLTESDGERVLKPVCIFKFINNITGVSKASDNWLWRPCCNEVIQIHLWEPSSSVLNLDPARVAASCIGSKEEFWLRKPRWKCALGAAISASIPSSGAGRPGRSVRSSFKMNFAVLQRVCVLTPGVAAVGGLAQHSKELLLGLASCIGGNVFWCLCAWSFWSPLCFFNEWVFGHHAKKEIKLEAMKKKKNKCQMMLSRDVFQKLRACEAGEPTYYISYCRHDDGMLSSLPSQT